MLPLPPKPRRQTRKRRNEGLRENPFSLCYAKPAPPRGRKPSQALPRQLSRRESQAVKFIAKGLGVMRKFLAVLLALPLGELAKPLGFD